MPFIPAWLAASLIGAGGSVGSALLARRGLKRSPEEQAAFGAQAENVRMGGEFGRRLFPFAERFYGQAERAFNPVLDYWTKLLRGDRSTLASALSPEISQITRGYGTALQTARELAPRGGGSSAFFTQLPFEQARDIGTLFAGVRPQAAGAVGDLATRLAGMGQGAAGTAGGLLSGSSYGASNLLDYGLRRRGQEFEQGGAIGRGLFELLQWLQRTGIFGRAGIPKAPAGLGPGGAVNIYKTLPGYGGGGR